MAEHRREHDLLTCSQKELNMKSSAVLQVGHIIFFLNLNIW